MLFIEYPKCSTCQKAKKYLEENKIKFIDRHIVENNPIKEEIKEWVSKYNLDIAKMFNTSGIKYRELGLKEKLKTMSNAEKINILASDGMLIKRPLIIADDKVLIGFKIKEWEDYFKRR